MPMPFTPEQIAHRLAIIAKHNGDIRAAAQEMQVKYTSLREWNARLPDWQRAPTPTPEVKQPDPPLPKEIHDAAFWRKKAAAQSREIGELEHLTEQLAGVRGIPYQVPEYAAPAPANGRAQSVVGIHWSDTHMCEVIDAEEIGGINAFNSEI